jgi:hypothetical protein
MAALTSVAPAVAAPAAALQSVVTGHVSPIPARGTPQLAPAGGTGQIRQIVECGGTMYAVGTFPLTGLCDVAAAFPAAQAGGLHPTWVSYTGCDSLYSAAADGSTVYVGGHERWADNPRGCNEAGPGAIPAPGMGAFTPDGSLLTKVNGTAGRYSRARGFGADDMLRTSAGLWIASDNFDDSVTCDGVTGHAGICFLPNS